MKALASAFGLRIFGFLRVFIRRVPDSVARDAGDSSPSTKPATRSTVSGSPEKAGDFAKDSAATMVVTIMTLGLGLLTGLIVARILGPDGRGALTAVLTAPQLLGWLFGMGCGKAVTFFLSRDRTIGAKLLSSWVVILLPVGLAAVPLADLLLPSLLAAQSEETLVVARLYAPIILLSLLTELLFGLILGDQNFKAYNALRLLQPAGTVVAYLLLWQAGRFDVAGAVLAQAFMSLVVFVLAGVLCLRRHGVAWPDYDLGRRSLWYALRVHGGVISGVVTQRFDLMIMPAFLAASSVGLYAVSTNIAWILITIFGSLATIVMPAATRRGENGRELVLKCVHATLIFGALLGGGLFVFAELAIWIVYGEAFLGSALPLRILLPGVVLYAAANILYNGLYTENRPFSATGAQLVGMLVTVAGLLLFLPSGGMLAAAITSTAAYACVFVTAAFLYQRAVGRPWSAFLPDRAAFRAILQEGRARLGTIAERLPALKRTAHANTSSSANSTNNEGKKAMRISLLTPEYPPGERLGGIATHTHTMARALTRAGHEVQVVTPGVPGTHREEGVTVVRVGIGMRLHPILDRFRINRSIARAALRWRPDVVHAAEFDANAWWLTRFSKIPVVTRLATPSGMVKSINGKRWVPHTFLLDFLERDQTRRSAAVYAPTRAISVRVGDGWGIAPEGIQVIPNSLNLSAVREAGARLPAQPLPERFIVFFGRLEARKGIVPLGQALPAVLTAHPDVNAVIVGGEDPESAAEIARFKSDVARVADRVHLVGELPREEALAIVARAEISVVPSLWENFGFVVVEALALGVPVVASACGGNPEIIEPGRSGWLVQPGDGDALRDELLARLGDRKVLAAARETARERSDEFDSDRVARRVSDLLQRACASVMPTAFVLSHAAPFV
ncbi:glycosyltransferase [Azospirillum sp. SYSU D00513]|uniref:glycosyltransferase n=1 Tax=Azospirillum sp. SYSU D00513 TaxID=2812561 RepID=UPI00249476EA|nr:glycosyltransferase [Azospirillum sp. SYSU D00513]